jgi:hypothetical protein
MAKHQKPLTIDEIMSKDMSAIALPDDKIAECAFFLELASRESNRSRFRWLMSAFLNAVYSYFEIKALAAHTAYPDVITNEYIEDAGALTVLRKYVGITQSKNNPSFVKTSALDGTLETLYELRKKNTHHYPLAFTTSGATLPEGYLFGYLKSKGKPALEFCRNVMSLIEQIEKELSGDAP